MADSNAFVNKVALVTGGSRGIGYAIAHALASRGTRVGITGRDGGRLSTARDELARAGAPIEAIRADVREPDEVRQAVRRTVERFGGLDVLVNNAAIGYFRTVEAMTDAEWRDVI